MPEIDSNPTRNTKTTPKPSRNSFSFARGKKKSFSEVLVCRLDNETIQGIHLKNTGSGLVSRGVTVTTVEEATNLKNSLGRKCPIIVVLGKSKYLLKVLDVPKVATEEVATLLSLEAEALLPHDYGAVEISYQPVPSKREEYQTYQIHLCRREALSEEISVLSRLDIKVDYILPSAVIWKAVFEFLEVEIDLLVAPVDVNQLEIAENRKGHTLGIRVVDSSEHKTDGSQFEKGLIDCIRPILTETSPDNRPLKIGWLGRGCPSYLSNGKLDFQDISHHITHQINMDDSDSRPNTFLEMAGGALLTLKRPDFLQTCNMLPREMTLRRQQKSIYIRMACAMTCFLFAGLLTWAALKIAIFRYQKINTNLTQEISFIKTEGEFVGRRIQQLKAVTAARDTSNHFKNILEGLYEATPAGMTYSYVELGGNGEVRLRGQAESLSLPFLVPERLEKQPMFEQVLLRDAGQMKRDAGTITEFRIDCRLSQGEQK